MSSTLPTGLSGVGQEGDERSRLRAIRLRQVQDVSSAPPLHGDSLVYDDPSGHWVPLNVTPGSGEVTSDMLAPDSVTTDKIAPGAVGSTDIAAGAVGSTHLAPNSVGATHIQNNAIGNAMMGTDSVGSDEIQAGAVTDSEIGNRTITDTTVPSTDTNVLTTLLSNLANRIKAITGKAGWKDNPDTTLATAHAHHINTSNPHSTTAAQIGVAAGATNTPLSNSLPVSLTVADTSDAGISANASRADHIHGTPPLVTTSVDGFMRATDKTKLDGVDTGATNLALSAAVPDALTLGQAGAAGSLTTASKGDHAHQMPTAASIVSSLNSAGGIDADLWSGLSRSVQNGVIYQDDINADITLTSTYLTIMQQTLGGGGYLVLARFDFVQNSPSSIGTTFFTCELDGTDVAPGPMTCILPANAFQSFTGAWFVRTFGGTVRLRARTLSTGGTMPSVRRISGDTHMLVVHLGTA